MTTSISGTTGIVTPALDLTTPRPVIEGGTGTSTVKPYRMVLGTPITTTSGTSHDFTSLPTWVKRITVMLNGVSTNGTSQVRIQIGTSSGIETTGYLGVAYTIGSTGSQWTSAGCEIESGAGSGVTRHGKIILSLFGSNSWIFNANLGRSETVYGLLSAGSKTLAGTLDRIRLTTVNGTDTFDAGSFNILYEGYED